PKGTLTLRWGTLFVALLAATGCDWFGAPQRGTLATPRCDSCPAPGTPSATPGAISSPSADLSGAPSAGTPSRTESARRPDAGQGDVNLSHLNFLVEDVEIAGQPMAITHIYSEAPK